MSKRAINLLLLAGIVVLVGISLVLGAPRSTGGEGEKFGGTDSAVTEQLDEEGYQPWFSPIFQPGSGEVESGLFAVQAAIGAGIVGYCVGNLRGRRVGRRDALDPLHDGDRLHDGDSLHDGAAPRLAGDADGRARRA